MQETVRQLTNYGGFIRNKNALALTAADKETIDLMFEISKNEGDRHGKMPTFGRTTSQVSQETPREEEHVAETVVEEEKPKKQEQKKQETTKGASAKQPKGIEEDLITIVDMMKTGQEDTK
jgi:hypothetical protein